MIYYINKYDLLIEKYDLLNRRIRFTKSYNAIYKIVIPCLSLNMQIKVFINQLSSSVRGGCDIHGQATCFLGILSLLHGCS